MKTVCVVGAGPAGLVAAKTLLHHGFNVTILERANRLGGIWAVDPDTVGGYLSPQTPTNLSRFAVGFSDLDWNSVKIESGEDDESPRGDRSSARIPIFPKAWHVNRYLETYRQRYIAQNIIKFEHEVKRVERLEGAEACKWRVHSRDKQNREEAAEYDYLVLCSGFFASPRPLSQTIQSMSTNLKIKTIHSSEYRSLKDLFDSPDQAAGKKILIIGGGNSAGEVAAVVAQQISNANYSPETGRQQPYKDCKIVHVTPRPLYAIPPFMPCDESSTTFTIVDCKLYDLSKRPPGPVVANAGRVAKVVKDMIHGALQTAVGGDQSDLGASALAIPSSEPRSTVYVALSESYPEFVRSGLIEVIGGRVQSLEVDDQHSHTALLKLNEGSVKSIDELGAIIYATGYSLASAVHFLPKEVKQKMQYAQDSTRLPLILQGWQTTAAAVPELSLIGFYEGPYWPIMEMQARLTARRWAEASNLETRPYEETTKLLDLRQAMQDKALDVPQYWFGDYLGYMEEVASDLGLRRNDGLFAEREGAVSPARYLSSDTDKTEADSIMDDLHQVWQACTVHGRYVARAVFRALQGNWNTSLTICSAPSSVPTGTIQGKASFLPRSVSTDRSGQPFDLEYLYVESDTPTLSNGTPMPAERKYVYRYSEERDEISLWFVKPDNDLEVDHLLHTFVFVSPDEARKEGACIARANHPYGEDVKSIEYRLPMKGISLHSFQVRQQVKGSSKDHVTIRKYERPTK